MGNPIPNWDFAALAGAGAIKSNVQDLSRFVLAQFDTTQIALQFTQASTFKINGNMTIGLGWHILTDRAYHWHNGGTGGYTSSMAFAAQQKCGIVILSNVSAFHADSRKIDELALILLKLLTEQKQ